MEGLTQPIGHVIKRGIEFLQQQNVEYGWSCLQVEVQVSVRSSAGVPGGDMELLPLRDLSVRGRGERWVHDFKAVLGPLCFL